MNGRVTRSLLLLVLLTGIVSAVSAAATGAYRWVDEAGNVHYSDVPPPGQLQQVERVRVQTTPADPEKAAALAKAREEAAQQAAEQQAQAAKDAQAAAAEQARLARQCAMARNNLVKLQNTNRAYTATADGGRRYYTDAEMTSRRTQAQARVNEYCR